MSFFILKISGGGGCKGFIGGLGVAKVWWGVSGWLVGSCLGLVPKKHSLYGFYKVGKPGGLWYQVPLQLSPSSSITYSL